MVCLDTRKQLLDFTVAVLVIDGADKQRSKKAEFGCISGHTNITFESAEGSGVKLTGKSRG